MLRAPAHPWTLDAAEAHVSRATLVRIFRREGNLAPLGFLSELRLGLARQRLGSTKGTAAAVGYDSESAFARAGARPATSIASSRARSQPTCRCRGRPLPVARQQLSGEFAARFPRSIAL
jgi:AraC family transcriptional regulator, activator of mtrCDE